MASKKAPGLRATMALVIFAPTALSMAPLGLTWVSSVRSVRPSFRAATTFAARTTSARRYCLTSGRDAWVTARLTTQRAPLLSVVKWQSVTKSRGLKGPNGFVADHEIFVVASQRSMSSHSTQYSLKSLARAASAKSA